MLIAAWSWVLVDSSIPTNSLESSPAEEDSLLFKLSREADEDNDEMAGEECIYEDEDEDDAAVANKDCTLEEEGGWLPSCCWLPIAAVRTGLNRGSFVATMEGRGDGAGRGGILPLTTCWPFSSSITCLDPSPCCTCCGCDCTCSLILVTVPMPPTGEVEGPLEGPAGSHCPEGSGVETKRLGPDSGGMCMEPPPT